MDQSCFNVNLNILQLDITVLLAQIDCILGVVTIWEIWSCMHWSLILPLNEPRIWCPEILDM